MKGSNFNFDGVSVMHYICIYALRQPSIVIDHTQILLNRLKSKRATKSLKNDGDICFQYAITIALNLNKLENIGDGNSRITENIHPFINQYRWKDFSAHAKDLKKLVTNKSLSQCFVHSTQKERDKTSIYFKM